MTAQTSWLEEPQAMPAGDSDEWYTPARVFQPLHQELAFTLDACATAESAKCPRFFTKAQDGLAQSWEGERVWMNPPYSDITPWVEKARHEAEDGAELVAALLPAWTDRAWWHVHVEPYRHGLRALEVGLRFIRGRVVFGYPGNPTGLGAKGGTFPSVIVVWRVKQ